MCVCVSVRPSELIISRQFFFLFSLPCVTHSRHLLGCVSFAMLPCHRAIVPPVAKYAHTSTRSFVFSHIFHVESIFPANATRMLTHLTGKTCFSNGSACCESEFLSLLSKIGTMLTVFTYVEYRSSPLCLRNDELVFGNCEACRKLPLLRRIFP